MSEFKKTETKKIKTSKEIVEDLDYLFQKVNWDKSWLDSKAIVIMNEVFFDIKRLDRKALNPNL